MFAPRHSGPDLLRFDLAEDCSFLSKVQKCHKHGLRSEPREKPWQCCACLVDRARTTALSFHVKLKIVFCEEPGPMLLTWCDPGDREDCFNTNPIFWEEA